MVDPASLQRDLAYNKSIMQSAYGDPNKAGLYREAERRVYEILKLLESITPPQNQYYQQPQYQEVVYNDPFHQNGYNTNNAFPQAYGNTSSNTTGVDMVNTRYSNKSNNRQSGYSNQSQQTTQVVQEQPKPIERKPHMGNEYPFVTDEYTTASKENDGDRYLWVFNRVEKSISNYKKEVTLSDHLLGLKNGLLVVNRDEDIIGIVSPLEFVINECYVENTPYTNKMKLEDFNLISGNVELYPDYMVNSIDTLLTRVYNLTLACNNISITTSDVREDFNELEKLASTNKVRNLVHGHESAIEKIETLLNNKLRMVREEVNGNIYFITYLEAQCILIPTSLAIKIKKTNLNGKFVAVNRKSHKSLNDAMSAYPDGGVLLYRTNTGGIGYFLFGKSEFNSFYIAI